MNEREQKDPIILKEAIIKFDLDVEITELKEALNIFEKYGIDEALITKLAGIYENHYDDLEYSTYIAEEWCELLTDIQYASILKAFHELYIKKQEM